MRRSSRVGRGARWRQPARRPWPCAAPCATLHGTRTPGSQLAPRHFGLRPRSQAAMASSSSATAPMDTEQDATGDLLEVRAIGNIAARPSKPHQAPPTASNRQQPPATASNRQQPPAAARRLILVASTSWPQANPFQDLLQGLKQAGRLRPNPGACVKDAMLRADPCAAFFRELISQKQLCENPGACVVGSGRFENCQSQLDRATSGSGHAVALRHIYTRSDQNLAQWSQPWLNCWQVAPFVAKRRRPTTLRCVRPQGCDGQVL